MALGVQFGHDLESSVDVCAGGAAGFAIQQHFQKVNRGVGGVGHADHAVDYLGYAGGFHLSTQRSINS